MSRTALVALSISLFALVANQGCADGDESANAAPDESNGDDDSSETTTKPPVSGNTPATSGGTTKPGTGDDDDAPGGDVDGGAGGGGGGGGGDGGTGGGGGGAACPDFDDVGGTEDTAKKLAKIDDCDGSGDAALGVINGQNDVDMYTFEVDDKFQCRIGATTEITAPGLELCMFIRCAKGTTAIQGCGAGTAAKSGGGVAGCCRKTPGPLEPDYNCDGTNSEDATVFLRVRNTANTCTSYTARYHF